MKYFSDSKFAIIYKTLHFGGKITNFIFGASDIRNYGYQLLHCKVTSIGSLEYMLVNWSMA